MKKLTIKNRDYDYKAIIDLMDNELKNEILAQKALYDNEQEFFLVYSSAHEARFGEDFAGKIKSVSVPSTPTKGKAKFLK
ncbi:MAG: hypothetical protein OXB88_05645 [Bacteriovoracales bacterium]|nr:hypothetical protein [Bacteriovoracales bacterium]